MKKETKKIDFKTIKKNTLKSLNDVETFLSKTNKISLIYKVYKTLKNK